MRLIPTLAAALAIAALAAPVASAEPPDMHASTAAAAAQERAKQDLRSPDARDAATAATQSRDLRTPDARDAAIHLRRSNIVVGTTQPVSKPAPVAPATTTTSTGSDVDWVTVALGIATGLLAIGCVALVAARRRTPRLRPSA